MFSFEGRPQRSGGNSEEVPPVPIPNTEVKLLSVYDTWRVTARENGTLPEQKEIGETEVSPINLSERKNREGTMILSSSVGRARDC